MFGVIAADSSNRIQPTRRFFWGASDTGNAPPHHFGSYQYLTTGLINQMASQTEAAAHVFLTVARFRELLKSGVVTEKARGEYDLETVRRECLTHLRQQAAGRRSGKAADAKARREIAQAEKAELELARLKNENVPLEMVVDLLSEIRVAVRGRLIALPSACAPLIPSEWPPAKVEAVIREKVDEALEAVQNARIETDKGS